MTIKSTRGFIQLSFLGWAAVGAFLLILGLSIALKVQSARLEAVQAEYGAFKTEVKRLGEEQEKKTKETIARDIKEKERRDADYKSRIARLERDNKRLRDSSGKSDFPAPASGSPNPDRATFDRAELNRALQRFTGGVAELVIEGAKAVEGLDSLK
jgi:septal ring factor EnvC (AmiA/AmiB activator)